MRDAKAILDEIAAQYGLLKVQAHGWYGFLHLTLQEYFAALAATRLLRGMLYAVSPTDPGSFAVVLLALLGVSLLACYLPARRAARVAPAVVLRSE